MQGAAWPRMFSLVSPNGRGCFKWNGRRVGGYFVVLMVTAQGFVIALLLIGKNLNKW